MTAQEILNGAADRLETKGWTQGQMALTTKGRRCGVHWTSLFDDEDLGETCVTGAIRLAAGDPRTWQETSVNDGAVETAKLMLCEFLKVPRLADWNDEPKRTKLQVIAALRAAASA